MSFVIVTYQPLPQMSGRGVKKLKSIKKIYRGSIKFKKDQKIFTTYKAVCCFPGLVASGFWFLGFLAFRLPSLVASRLPSLSASRLLGFPASRLLVFAASRLLGFLASGLLGFLASGLLGHMCTITRACQLPGFLASRIRGFCPSSLLGFLASQLSWLLGTMCVPLLL